MARQRHNAAFITGSILGGVGGAAAAMWTTPRSGAELRAMVSERLGTIGGGSAGTPAHSEVPASTASSNASRVSNATRASFAQVSRVSKASRDSVASTASKGWGVWNATSSPKSRSFGGRALSFVENATAPIVGVKLGQSARNMGSKAMESVHPGGRDSATTPGAEPAPVAPATVAAPLAPVTVAAPVAPVTRERVVSSTPPPVAPATADALVAPVEPRDSPAPRSTVDADDSGVGQVASTEDLVTPVAPDEPSVTSQETSAGSDSGSGSFTDFPDFEADKRPR